MTLLRGLAGHPLHPPLTDATIGIYTGATAFAVLGSLGVSEGNMATAAWACRGPCGYCANGTHGTCRLARDRGRHRTLEDRDDAPCRDGERDCRVLIAAIVGHGAYVDREVTAGLLVLVLIGFAC